MQQKLTRNFVQYFFENFCKTLDFWGSKGYNIIKVVKSGEKITVVEPLNTKRRSAA
jgi:hypothetical protein